MDRPRNCTGIDLDQFAAKVSAVTKEEADAAFARLVDPGTFTIVSAGTFRKKLRVVGSG